MKNSFAQKNCLLALISPGVSDKQQDQARKSNHSIFSFLTCSQKLFSFRSFSILKFCFELWIHVKSQNSALSLEIIVGQQVDFLFTIFLLKEFQEIFIEEPKDFINKVQSFERKKGFYIQ